MNDTLNDFFKFSKLGYSEKARKGKNIFTFKKFAYILITLQLIGLGLSAIVIISLNVLNLDYPKNHLSSIMLDEKIYYLIIMGCIFSPITEEIAFRLCLKYSKINFTLSLGFLIFITFNILSVKNKEINEIKYIFLIFSCVFIYIMLTPINTKKITSIWSKYSRSIMYGFIILFSLSHLSNLNINYHNLLPSILLVIPQASAGLILSYSRLRFGLISSIILHSSSNFLVIIESYLLTN